MPKTLFVDDDQMIIDMWREQCGMLQVSSVFAMSHAEAINAIDDGDIERVIVDGTFPYAVGDKQPMNKSEGLNVLGYAKAKRIANRWFVGSDHSMEVKALDSDLATFTCEKDKAVTNIVARASKE